jgi:hypothetical protein
MRGVLYLFLGLSLCLPAYPLAAQEAVAQPLEIGPDGQKYLDEIRFSGIEANVGYFDPSGAAPKLDAEQAPPPPPKDEARAPLGSLPNMVALVAAVLLVAMIALAVRFGGGIALSGRAEAENLERSGRRPRRATMAAEAGPPADLQSILMTSDRRLAMVQLAQLALQRTVAANGVLLQDSWTARDALRHIPRTQAHLEALRRLVMAGEWVQFGHRDVSEEEFQSQLQGVRPLLTARAA